MKKQIPQEELDNFCHRAKCAHQAESDLMNAHLLIIDNYDKTQKYTRLIKEATAEMHRIVFNDVVTTFNLGSSKESVVGHKES